MIADDRNDSFGNALFHPTSNPTARPGFHCFITVKAIAIDYDVLSPEECARVFARSPIYSSELHFFFLPPELELWQPCFPSR